MLLILAGCTGTGTGTTDSDATGVPDDLDAITSDVRPDKRSEIRTVAYEPANSILVFGGNDGPIVDQIPMASFRKDTWIFEPGTGWTEVTGPSPSKRSRYALTLDEAGHRALLFGGRFRESDQGGNYTLHNDLWAFDFETRAWTELDDGSSSDDPPPRYYANGAWDAETGILYEWGGNVNVDPLAFEVTSDLFAWDGETWDQLETTGDAPSSRSFLGSLHDTKRNKLVVFGGQIGDLFSQAYNDTYALDLDTLKWTQLHDGETTPVPSTRMHAGFAYDAPRDRYLLFGGHTDLGDMNDLWAMDPESHVWSRVYIADTFNDVPLGCLGNPREVPADYVDMDLSAPERRHLGMFALMYDSAWIFGGMHAECSEHLDDTWRYDLLGDSWHELVEARTGESCLRRQDDCECLCL
jgi:hypothetical protein